MKKEMSNKKGVSTIIVTVIMITIVLAAVGVVWVMIQNILDQSSSDIDLNSKCLKVNLVATKMVCSDATTCDVTINRKAGGDEIGGVKLIFSNTTSGNVGEIVDVAGNIQELGTDIAEDKEHGLTALEKPNNVEIAVYFLDESGAEQLCSQTKKFSF